MWAWLQVCSFSWMTEQPLGHQFSLAVGLGFTVEWLSVPCFEYANTQSTIAYLPAQHVMPGHAGSNRLET